MIKLTLADDKTRACLNIKNQAYVITDGGETLGFCEFELCPPSGKIIRIECDNIPLIDGVFRQTLFYMAQNMCLIAELTDGLCKKLGEVYLIKKGQKEINISEFFNKSCH